MKNKINLLKNVDLFSKLQKEELKIIAENSDIEKYSQGTEIYKEGSSGNELYIIQEGEIIIKQKTDGSRQNTVAKFIKDECFGEMDLFENVPRMGTAICETDSVLLHFPRKGVTLKEVLEKYPDISVRLLHKVIAMIAARMRKVNRLISEKTPWVKELRKKLFIDKLTGFYNKNFMDEKFPFMLADFKSNLCLLYIKPDNFKDINDTYGHQAGDEALKVMAVYIYSLVRDEEMAIRYKGDEFVVVLPNISKSKAREKAKELKSTIYHMNLKDITRNEPFRMTLSIGISLFPKEAKDDSELIDSAYNKMMNVRKNGGNGIDD